MYIMILAGAGMSSSEGSVSLCIEETVGGQQWSGNRTIIERAVVAAGGDPNTHRGEDTAPCQVPAPAILSPPQRDPSPGMI